MGATLSLPRPGPPQRCGPVPPLPRPQLTSGTRDTRYPSTGPAGRGHDTRKEEWVRVTKRGLTEGIAASGDTAREGCHHQAAGMGTSMGWGHPGSPMG